jgi:hypothetical protein
MTPMAVWQAISNLIEAVRVTGFLLRIGDHSQRTKQGLGRP